jgi:hypothetical protein
MQAGWFPLCLLTLKGPVAMTDADFHYELMSRLRAISNNCVDQWAVGRLRAMAAEIEERLCVPVSQTTLKQGGGLHGQR